jgi:hypothetical protein
MTARHIIAAIGVCAAAAGWPVTAQSSDVQNNPGKETHMTMQQDLTMQRDLATRAKEIHWPAGFDPEQADLF